MAVTIREKHKGSGEWWIFMNHKGKRKSKKIGRDKRLAREVARKIEAHLILGDNGIIKNIPTFDEYAEIWINIYVPANRKPSSVINYKLILEKHILPTFRNKRVTDINRFFVKEFLMKKINEGYAQNTVRNIRNCLCGVLNLAIDDNTIQVNPGHKLGNIYGKKKLDEDGDNAQKIDALTREELTLLLSTIKEHFPKHYPLVLTLARTGMRLGEALALKWSDIDFHNRFIIVQRNIVKGHIGTPKNGKSRRLDMSMQLSQTLKNLKLERDRWGLPQVIYPMNSEEQLEQPINSEWLFPGINGMPMGVTHWRKDIFYKALEMAGLRRIRIHDLRHTFASLLIQAGESLVYVKEQLGHSSIRITVDTYGHLVPGSNKSAVDKLDDDAPDCTLYAPRNFSAVASY